MSRWAFAFLLLLSPAPALCQDKAETREMVGHIGSRSAYLVLHAIGRADGGWHMTGEYLLLPSLQRRFLEGERSPQLGVTTLREGTSAILFGRPATGELRGALREGNFRGTRYGPGGQERERFEFSEDFPSMDGYSARVRCEAGDGRYQSALRYEVEGGRLKGEAFEWRATIAPGGQRCAFASASVQPMPGGMKVVDGRCEVTLRDLGDLVKVSAANCEAVCSSGGYLEPLLVDRRGYCRLLRPEPR